MFDRYGELHPAYCGAFYCWQFHNGQGWYRPEYNLRFYTEPECIHTSYLYATGDLFPDITISYMIRPVTGKIWFNNRELDDLHSKFYTGLNDDAFGSQFLNVALDSSKLGTKEYGGVDVGTYVLSFSVN